MKAARTVTLTMALLLWLPLALDAQEELRTDLAIQQVMQAIKMQEKGRHEQAIPVFDSAWSLDAHPKILFFKARSLMALERWEEARVTYRLIQQNTMDLQAVKLDEVSLNLSLIEEHLQVTLLKVTTPGVEGASVVLDGKALGASPVSVELKRGTYALRADKPGYQSARVTVEVRGEDTLPVALTLVAGATQAPTVGAAAPAEAGSSRRLWAWITAGGGAAALAGGVVAFVQHASASSEAAEGDEVKPYGLYTGGALSAVAVGLGVTSAVLFLGGDDEPVVAAAPWMGADGAGLAVTLRF
jgi:hypothetical protein